MPYTQSTKTGKKASAGSSAAAPSSTSSTTASPSPCGCGCHDHTAEPARCCKLTCFERPQYFCGQLLSDADLTLQETYFREKNKLYHRSLDGFGVVCGLQMRCDGHCKGHITIGDGYAIDCCGNDLLVCEPRSFDVIGELRRRKWLVEIHREHHHGGEYRIKDKDNRDGEGDCIIKQCFYVGICYAEEPVDFATPYTTECNPAPGPCQPTRIREGVRFELYDKQPVRPDPLDEIGKRIECCFRMFREGQFSRGLASVAQRILTVLGCCSEQGSGTTDRESLDHEAHCLFEELRAQFLHELRTCPDLYNCDLEHEVCRLRPPRLNEQDTGLTPLEAFTRLFELIQKYVFSCVLAQLTVSCPEPSDPCCVLIGSVEVENGRLTRVINYPRWYLPCFANFWEVWIYKLANEAACGKQLIQSAGDDVEHPRKDKRNGCCPGFEVDVCQLLKLFSADKSAFEQAARTSVDAIQAIYRALVEGFNFMRPGGIAPAVLRNLDTKAASELARTFGIDLRPLTAPEAAQPDVFSALADNRIYFGPETLVYEGDRTITRVNGVMGAPGFAVGNYAHPMISDLMERHTRAEERLKSLENELATLKAKVNASSRPPSAQPTPPQEGPK